MLESVAIVKRNFHLTELQNRMSQMNEGLGTWDRHRRVSVIDYEEKQMMAINGKIELNSSSQVTEYY